MEIGIFTCHSVAIATEHGIEESPACDNLCCVRDCVLLEEDLEDGDHDDDVTDCQADEGHGFHYHLQSCHNQNRNRLDDKEERDESAPGDTDSEDLYPVEDLLGADIEDAFSIERAEHAVADHVSKGIEQVKDGPFIEREVVLRVAVEHELLDY